MSLRSKSHNESHEKSKLTSVVVVLLLFCATAMHAQIGSNPRSRNLQIHVQVRYPDGTAASRGIAVMVEWQNGGVVAQTQTDAQGKANIVVTEPSFYTVSINQAGFQRPASQQADLNTASSAYLNFEIKPVNGRTVLPAQGQVDANAVPERAMKEYRKGEKLLLQEQKSEESISHFQKALKEDDKFQSAYVMLGMAYLDQRKPSDAQVALEKAIQLDPNSAAAHLELGAAYNQQKKYPDAERELKRGLELNPDAVEGEYEIAKTYWETGNVTSAETYATRAAERRPDMAAVHVLLGNVALRKNDPNRALKEFNEYLRLDPKGGMAAPVQEMVKKIEKSAAPK